MNIIESDTWFEPGYVYSGYDLKLRKCVQFTYDELLRKRDKTLKRILFNSKLYIGDINVN